MLEKDRTETKERKKQRETQRRPEKNWEKTRRRRQKAINRDRKQESNAGRPGKSGGQDKGDPVTTAIIWCLAGWPT